MAQQYQPDPELPNYNLSVYDIDNIRILEASRAQPLVEAAELRRRRRRRIRKRRSLFGPQTSMGTGVN